MGEALFWGLIASSSLVRGGLVGLFGGALTFFAGDALVDVVCGLAALLATLGFALAFAISEFE